MDDEPDQAALVQTNNKPVADAGPDQNVANGALVSLDGSNSRDPDGDEINFRWRILATPQGSATQLSGPETATPTFIADVDGLYCIELVVVEEAEV
ncbi:MAG: PKD domain-containing protein, partial [Nitrospiria bacterium]